MLVRQSKNSFIRCYNGYGYITNQLTYHDRAYNETGADFLKELSRRPQDVDVIVRRLLELYEDIDFQSLKNDFMEFLVDLADRKFIVLGETSEELDANDIGFSYSLENPKTMAEDFSQPTSQRVTKSTQDYNFEMNSLKPQLSGLQFELTSRCNERCIHCYIPNGKKNAGQDMPTEKVCDLLDQYADMGGLQVTLSGGEVLMHKDIGTILRYCRQKDFKISLLTNLIALRDAQIPMLKEVNLSIVQTSLYSMVPEIHDSITTVKGSFARTKAAIEKLVAADIPVQISCPVMKANYKGYKEVLKYARLLKIKAQTDFIMMAQSDCDTSNLANRISLKETEELLRDIIEYDIDYRNNILTQRPISDEIVSKFEAFVRQPVCGVGINSCCIAENGDVYPCAGWQAYVLGNVNEQSLQEIWEKSEKINALRKITQGAFPKCLKCEARDFCAMCLVRNFNESGGDMFKINDHFCKVAFLNKRLVEEYYSKHHV
ncbi:PqqD family peptide modification chaperone [Alistipes sp.]|uniref:radical SAM protein n=1 Tax=Alistipes sp. TaxID=1872444 RepID=UPI003A84AB2A